METLRSVFKHAHFGAVQIREERMHLTFLNVYRCPLPPFTIFEQENWTPLGSVRCTSKKLRSCLEATEISICRLIIRQSKTNWTQSIDILGDKVS